VAVCAAIEAVTGEEPKIKWINDILINGKKVCGILSEAVTSLESGGVEWIVVGLGINICEIPEDIRDIASSLYKHDPGDIIRIRLAAAILRRLLPAPKSEPEMHTEYKKRLSMLGQTVTVNTPAGSYEAFAEDIDPQFRLAVRLPNGEYKYLSSGEVSVRLKSS
jgi:BirA family biotin operon repressor/biotin-[acetyl-CoA-carboxylase] ligase